MCTLIPESSSSHIQYTPGGLIYKPGGSNMQHVTSIAFLLLTYAKYLSRTSQTVNCGSISVGPSSLRLQAKKQVLNKTVSGFGVNFIAWDSLVHCMMLVWSKTYRDARLITSSATTRWTCHTWLVTGNGTPNGSTIGVHHCHQSLTILKWLGARMAPCTSTPAVRIQTFWSEQWSAVLQRMMCMRMIVLIFANRSRLRISMLP